VNMLGTVTRVQMNARPQSASVVKLFAAEG
jgi:hypothetical protein